ncbi:MAG: 3-dehydroquinate synthase [Nitritalea sp.]
MQLPSVSFTTDIRSHLREALEQLSFSSLAVLCDTNTHAACYPLVAEVLPPHAVFAFSAGEQQKHLQTCMEIWRWMTEQQLDRQSLLLNIGGGVTGDMGGFCAATYKRGIRFLNVPTSLLAQVDASVGGKLGVDFMGFKNHLGVFSDPESVLIDATFLSSLPERELRSGFAEIIKHGLIQDAAYFQSLSSRSDWKAQDWPALIQHSVAIKQAVVQEDPKEKGLRRILNFGHTVGHAVESHFLETAQPLLHGEAIALGMIAEAFLSWKHTGLPEEALHLITRYLLDVFGKVALPLQEFPQLLERCLQDKKNAGSTIQLALLADIGTALPQVPLTLAEVEESLHYYVAQSLELP